MERWTHPTWERRKALSRSSSIGLRSRSLRQGNRRLGRRLARAPEAVAGRPEGRPLSGSSEPPRAARSALRRHRSRAGALPRLQFEHAAAP
eukprot:scaffold111722_cov75-Phaeocystis_antarctica.AAC.2